MNDLNPLYSEGDIQIQGTSSGKVPKEIWTVCNNVQEAVMKNIPEKKKFKKAKSEEALQVAEKEENRKAEEKDIPN